MDHQETISGKLSNNKQKKDKKFKKAQEAWTKGYILKNAAWAQKKYFEAFQCKPYGDSPKEFSCRLGKTNQYKTLMPGTTEKLKGNEFTKIFHNKLEERIVQMMELCNFQYGEKSYKEAVEYANRLCTLLKLHRKSFSKCKCSSSCNHTPTDRTDKHHQF